jgi:hypothetical protein
MGPDISEASCVTMRGMHRVLIGSLLLASLWLAGLDPTAAPVAGRLEVCGRALCTPDGSRFSWRGVTAFGLVDLVADKREADAQAFMAWAARTGFTVVRVLAMNRGWMDLSPADGRRALPRTLAMARAHGLYVQVVALAGTGTREFSSDAFLQDQVRAVAQACATADNCVLELANEPYHSTQATLNDAARMGRLQRGVPPGLPVAWGAARDHRSEDMAGGTYVVAHVARRGNRWDRVSRVQELGEVSRRTGKFVVDSEPIGAAEAPQPSRRDNEPAAFFAQGLLARIFDVGTTFHCEDCLLARLPGPVQQQCAEALIAGATLPSPAAALTPIAVGAPTAPVARLEPLSPQARTFAAVAPSEGVVLVLGTSEPPRPSWQRDWAPTAHVSRWAGLHAWRVAKK